VSQGSYISQVCLASDSANSTPRANRAKGSCGGCETCYDSVRSHASQQNVDHCGVITEEPFAPVNLSAVRVI
jgi:hypothetical protein